MTYADLVARVDRATRSHLGGETVTYRPEVGAPVDVVGIYSERDVLLEEGHAGLEATGLSVWLRLEDLPDDPEQTTPTITVRGNLHNVVARAKDGMGGITLSLHLAGA